MPLEYQEMFVDEARAVMGCPGAEQIEQYLGEMVECKLGDGKVLYGVLDGLGVSEAGTDVLSLNGRSIPLRAVEAIRAV